MVSSLPAPGSALPEMSNELARVGSLAAGRGRLFWRNRSVAVAMLVRSNALATIRVAPALINNPEIG